MAVVLASSGATRDAGVGHDPSLEPGGQGEPETLRSATVEV